MCRQSEKPMGAKEEKSAQIIQRTPLPDENDELAPEKPPPPAPVQQSQLKSVTIPNKNKWGCRNLVRHSMKNVSADTSP